MTGRRASRLGSEKECACQEPGPQVTSLPPESMVGPSTESAAGLLALQRAVGNRAAWRLASGAVVQPALRVGPAGDNFEREADRVADEVMRSLAASTPAPPVHEGARVRRSAQQGVVGLEGGEVGPDTEAAIQRQRGQGGGLPDALRQSMESAFAADFSGVKVHADSSADALNRDMQSRAFTVGSDIFFARGEYQPQSTSGQRLLAHELTHTVQQGAAASGPSTMGLVRREVLTSNPEDMEDQLEAAGLQRQTEGAAGRPQTIQREPKAGAVSAAHGPVIQRRGGATVGSLCIRSNAVNDGLTAGHAWLSYTPTGGTETTYGTWGNRAPIGLHRDLEVGIPFKASRCTDLDATDLAALGTFAGANNAWSITNNCASFAVRGWRAVTGESLSSGMIVSNPSALGASIVAAGGILVAAPAAAPAAAGGGSSSW